MILKRQEKDGLVKAMYDSSNIVASVYNNNTNDLEIIFKAGTRYKYPNVSKSDYMRFEIAESQGSVFNTHIKKYTYEKLTNVDASQIIQEADTLKVAEDNALIKAKQIELVNRLKDSLSIGEAISSDNDSSEARSLFIESLNKLKIGMENFINEVNK